MPDFKNSLSLNGVAASLAGHAHAAADVTSGVLAVARLATGTPDGTKFVRDDGTLAVPAGTGSATLAGDTDVAITSVADLDAIMYSASASKYVNKTGLGVMTAQGDLIVGAASGNINRATVAQGATASASTTFGGSSATNAIDLDDATEWNSSSNGSSTDWIKVDLGVARAIGVYRIKCAAGTLPSNAKIQSSTDNSTWTDQVAAPIPNLAETGQVTLGSTVTARYWRILLGAITDFPRIRSFELSTLGAAAGTQARLAVGTSTQYLKGGTTPAWGAILDGDLPATLSANARAAVSKDGTLIGTRRGLNFIGRGAVVADNSGSERVDISRDDPATMAYLKEEFLGGTSTSGSVGELGWALSGGTTTYLAGIANHPGIVRRDTSSTISTLAAMYIRASNGAFVPTDTFDSLCIARLNTNDANTTIRMGVVVAPTTSPTDGLFFEKVDADTNWFAVARNGGVQTRTDTTVAVGTGWVVMRVRRKDASTIGYQIGATVAACLAATEITITANIPTAVAWTGMQIINSAAASKTVDFDSWDLLLTGLTR